MKTFINLIERGPYRVFVRTRRERWERFSYTSFTSPRRRNIQSFVLVGNRPIVFSKCDGLFRIRIRNGCLIGFCLLRFQGNASVRVSTHWTWLPCHAWEPTWKTWPESQHAPFPYPSHLLRGCSIHRLVFHHCCYLNSLCASSAPLRLVREPVALKDAVLDAERRVSSLYKCWTEGEEGLSPTSLKRFSNHRTRNTMTIILMNPKFPRIGMRYMYTCWYVFKDLTSTLDMESLCLARWTRTKRTRNTRNTHVFRPDSVEALAPKK